MTYKSLGSKMANIGKSLGSKTYSLTSIGSKINPVSYIGNHIVKKAVDISAHKLMDKFAPLMNKKIK